MTLRIDAETTANEICELVGCNLDHDQKTKLLDIIEKALISVALETRNKSADVALQKSQVELDLAHEISREIRRSDEVLIANLSSMR